MVQLLPETRLQWGLEALSLLSLFGPLVIVAWWLVLANRKTANRETANRETMETVAKDNT